MKKKNQIKTEIEKRKKTKELNKSEQQDAREKKKER